MRFVGICLITISGSILWRTENKEGKKNKKERKEGCKSVLHQFALTCFFYNEWLSAKKLLVV